MHYYAWENLVTEASIKVGQHETYTVYTMPGAHMVFFVVILSHSICLTNCPLIDKCFDMVCKLVLLLYLDTEFVTNNILKSATKVSHCML